MANEGVLQWAFGRIMGGVPVGKMIAAKAVYKRQVLELGGNGGA